MITIIIAVLYCLMTSFLGVIVGVEFYKAGSIVSTKNRYYGVFKAAGIVLFWPITLAYGSVRCFRKTRLRLSGKCLGGGGG